MRRRLSLLLFSLFLASQQAMAADTGPRLVSEDLRAFTRLRIGDGGKLAAAVDAAPAYYASLRWQPERLAKMEPEIHEAVASLSRLLPWAELWREFLARKDGSDYAGWLYDGGVGDRPADLGYWMGYRIARAYYERAGDKAQSLRDMLAIGDAEAFLEASGLAGNSPGPELLRGGPDGPVAAFPVSSPPGRHSSPTRPGRARARMLPAPNRPAHPRGSD
jgi:hypothetical protein